eukprot:TRINITY_DN21505_c1_g1_i1.p2 TRINITY_DN21505_c1_g1~~TRINITY_DN21505_c1_g1_i1.p2  ORF type:complete len:212 (+),score=-1.78 TRINITY_DN21505_c1_g1_i1:162-797(+)
MVGRLMLFQLTINNTYKKYTQICTFKCTYNRYIFFDKIQISYQIKLSITLYSIESLRFQTFTYIDAVYTSKKVEIEKKKITTNNKKILTKTTQINLLILHYKTEPIVFIIKNQYLFQNMTTKTKNYNIQANLTKNLAYIRLAQTNKQTKQTSKESFAIILIQNAINKTLISSSLQYCILFEIMVKQFKLIKRQLGFKLNPEKILSAQLIFV